MNDIAELNFEALPLRVVMIDGTPWWLAMDVAAILGYKDANRIARMLQPDEVNPHNVGVYGAGRAPLIISESGLYAAILKSRRPEAQKFRIWVTSEVLPSIRKFGTYPPPAIVEPIPFKIGLTPAMRFLQERDRFNARSKYSFETIFKNKAFTASVMNGLEIGVGDLPALLTRDQRWIKLMSLGFDLPYVLWGQSGMALRNDYPALTVQQPAPLSLGVSEAL